jgi:hypothetical protein
MRAEYFVTSRFIGLDKLSKLITNDSSSYVCKTVVSQDLFVDHAVLFGMYVPLDPFLVSKGTRGVIFYCDGHLRIPFYLKRFVKVIPMDYLLLSRGIKGTNVVYTDYFDDIKEDS